MAVARSLVEYGRYGGDESAAAKVIRKRFPDRSLASCADALRLYVAAWRDAIAFVAENSRAYDERRANLAEQANTPFDAMEMTFLDRHPGIPPDLLRSALLAVHDWHHMR